MELKLNGTKIIPLKDWFDDKKIIIESGHIYTSEEPGIEHFMGLKFGKQLMDNLLQFGFPTASWLFVDDYNPKFEAKNEILDIEGFVSKINSQGTTIDKVIMESSLTDIAKDVIDGLASGGFTSKNGPLTTLNKKVSYGKAVLYDEETNHYACSVLDAAFYLVKAKESAISITVLPAQYKSQQKLTNILLTKLDKVGFKTNKEDTLQVYFSVPQESYMYPEIEPVVKDSFPVTSIINGLSEKNSFANKLTNYSLKVMGPKYEFHVVI